MRVIHDLMMSITSLNNWLGKWIARVLLIIFALLIAEVSFRYFVGSPKVWTNELAQMLFGAYAVLSGGYIMAQRGHVNVDILYSLFPTRIKSMMDIFTSTLFFIFVIALLYFGSSLAYESVSYWEHSQSAWDPPIWPVKLTIPIGAGLLLLQGIVKFTQDILTALNIEPPPGKTWGLELGDGNEH